MASHETRQGSLLRSQWPQCMDIELKPWTIRGPMIAAADRNMAMGGSLLQPGPSLLNIFPFLGYIPPSLAGPFKSRKVAGETLRLSRFIQNSLKDFIEKAMVSKFKVSDLRVSAKTHRKPNNRTVEQLFLLLSQISWRGLEQPKYLK